MSILIADSGSTKTDWCLIEENKKPKSFSTKGINPFFHTENDCKEILEKELNINIDKIKIDEIEFYGAGLKSDAKKEFLKQILQRHFNTSKIATHSDMLAAARATAGNEKAIVAILGTGSNSCFYNGKTIAKQSPSLGYIVGDEGGGTYLGKRVLQYFFYNTFDDELHDAFEIKYGNNLNDILENVYQKPFANRYLASFTQFLLEHKHHFMVQNIVEDAFIDFHQRHILKYRESWHYPIHFVGTVAYEFKNIIQHLHEQYGLETGIIIKSPIKNLTTYHQAILNER